MEIQIDVLVIGGSAPGSAAALQSGRTRRPVVMIDSGQPRNAPAAHMHGHLGHDGQPPGDSVQIAHNESRGIYAARRVVLASGITDVLPDIDGVSELWGERVIRCPWCHGWEVKQTVRGWVATSSSAQRVVRVIQGSLRLATLPSRCSKC